MTRFAPMPDPPYYAVIFSSTQTANTQGYGDMAEAMVEGAKKMDGFLGVESTRDAEGYGITISYWRDEKAIKAWKANAKHQVAQKMGHDRWYEHFRLRVAKVERSYEGP